MNYKSLIESQYETCEFNPPVDEEKLAALIGRIGPLPEELIDLLRETDGAAFGDLVRIFSVEDRIGYTFMSIIKEWSDPEYAQMYVNGSTLLFFADDGMGGFFGYEKRAEGGFGPIFWWDHEEDELIAVPQNGLAGFITSCEEVFDE